MDIQWNIKDNRRTKRLIALIRNDKAGQNKQQKHFSVMISNKMPFTNC